MIRTQIYLTEQQRAELDLIAQSTGLKTSELIRRAIDAYVAARADEHRAKIVRQTAGLWKDRADLPDQATLRAEWDREAP